jgi:hypothetical protein
MDSAADTPTQANPLKMGMMTKKIFVGNTIILDYLCGT